MSDERVFNVLAVIEHEGRLYTILKPQTQLIECPEAFVFFVKRDEAMGEDVLVCEGDKEIKRIIFNKYFELIGQIKA